MTLADAQPAAAGDNQTGTFKESLRAPIHRWFSYPVGFSPALVRSAIEQYELRPGDRLYDPFAGTATSLIVAREAGLEAHGLEAHPFIFFVGRTKLRWDVPPGLANGADELINGASAAAQSATPPHPSTTPALLNSCYDPSQLGKLVAILNHVRTTLPIDSTLRDLAELAVAAIARRAASVSTKWPYLEPRRKRVRAVPDAADLFSTQLRLMVSDLATVGYRRDWSRAELLNADARKPHPSLQEGSVDLVVSSAPYLNNFDYADRTRLETYLLGQYATWRELTEKVRRRLVMCATPQLDHLRPTVEEFLAGVTARDQPLGAELTDLVDEVAKAREDHKGDKRFHLVMAGYFGDMLHVLLEIRRLLKPVGRALLVLGDSALFGVHVRTDEMVGRLACAAGFGSYRVEHLRSRGAKWHSVRRSPAVPLREALLVLEP